MSFHGKKYVSTPKNNDPKGLLEKKSKSVKYGVHPNS